LGSSITEDDSKFGIDHITGEDKKMSYNNL